MTPRRRAWLTAALATGAGAGAALWWSLRPQPSRDAAAPLLAGLLFDLFPRFDF